MTPPEPLTGLESIFKRKPYLVWYVKNAKNLSAESRLEHILNYGDWDDFLMAEKAVGVRKLEFYFNKLKNKRRVNLRPQTVNYFENYFAKYV